MDDDHGRTKWLSSFGRNTLLLNITRFNLTCKWISAHICKLLDLSILIEVLYWVWYCVALREERFLIIECFTVECALYILMHRDKLDPIAFYIICDTYIFILLNLMHAPSSNFFPRKYLYIILYTICINTIFIILIGRYIDWINKSSDYFI